jgi:hypothetical protein
LITQEVEKEVVDDDASVPSTSASSSGRGRASCATGGRKKKVIELEYVYDAEMEGEVLSKLLIWIHEILFLQCCDVWTECTWEALCDTFPRKTCIIWTVLGIIKYFSKGACDTNEADFDVCSD